MPEENAGSRFLGPTLSITLLIIVLLLIPLVMEWRAMMDERYIRAVGRVCGGLAAGLSIYGVTTQALKILAVCAGAAITLAVLVSEGMIDLPKF